MDVNKLLLAVTIASLSLCIYTHFFMDMSKNHLIDPLTKVFNRYFISNIEDLERSGDKFYVIFADIDFFKKINDTHGHDAGDLVLKDFAKKLSNSIKSKKDYLIRYGGEEFILFLNVTNSSTFTPNLLKDRIENIREPISKMHIKYLEEEITMTASFGICSDLSIPITERITIADKCLYESKHTGRNKVTIS